MDSLQNVRKNENPRQPNQRRLTLTLTIGLFGSVLGATEYLINLLAQTQFPKVPEHLPLIPSIVVSSPAFLAGLVVSLLLTRVSTSDWTGQTADRARTLVVWMGLGIGYGLLLPLATGMLIAISWTLLSLATRGADEAIPWVTLLALQSPFSALVQLVIGLYTALIAGLVFGLGGWTIDEANASANLKVSTYGPIVIALTLSFIVLAITVFVPSSTLAKLG